MSPMNRKGRTAVVAGAAVAVIVLSLLLVFTPTARRVVLEPIVGTINAFRSLSQYMSQDLQWLIVLLVSFVIGLVYTISRLPRREKRRVASAAPRFPTEGPTMRIAQLIEQSSRYRHRNAQLTVELRDLAARVLARQRGIPVHEAKDLLDQERWTDVETVRQALTTDAYQPRHKGTQHTLARVDRILDEIERISQEA